MSTNRKGESRGSAARRRRSMLRTHGWECWLCGQPIDPEATGDFQLTIDHVIPIARGGSSRVENLRPAHQWCNERKADRVFEGVACKWPACRGGDDA